MLSTRLHVSGRQSPGRQPVGYLELRLRLVGLELFTDRLPFAGGGGRVYPVDLGQVLQVNPAAEVALHQRIDQAAIAVSGQAARRPRNDRQLGADALGGIYREPRNDVFRCTAVRASTCARISAD